MATFDKMIKDEDLLYNLFVSHVKNEIHMMIKPEIDKVINNAVDQAAKSLKGTLQQYYDPSTFLQNVKIIVEKR